MSKWHNHTSDKFRPKVLICDQEYHIREVLKEYLSSIGFFVDHAKNGYECIDIACRAHPDVILLDFDIPHMTGHTVIKHLRSLAIDVPVILFSSGGDVSPFDHLSAVLQKPFKPKEIAVVLETLLLETKKEKHFLPRRYKIH